MLLVAPVRQLDVVYNNIPERPLVSDATDPADNYTEWSVGDTYVFGQEVRYTLDGESYPRTFRATQEHSGQVPALKSAYWVHLGVNNRWRLFDGLNNSRSVSTESVDGNIEIHVNLSRATRYLYLFGLRNVSEVTVVQKIDGAEVSSHTERLSVCLTPVGWWSWLYGERDYMTTCAIELGGNYYTQRVEVFMNGNGLAQCAQLIFGNDYHIGYVNQGASPRLQSFSTFSPDTFGNYKYVKRKNTRVGSYSVTVETSEFDRVYRLIETFESELVIIDANNPGTQFDSMRHYGKITNFAPGVDYEETNYDIKIENIN